MTDTLFWNLVLLGFTLILTVYSFKFNKMVRRIGKEYIEEYRVRIDRLEQRISSLEYDLRKEQIKNTIS
jgi:hypothetical protein